MTLLLPLLLTLAVPQVQDHSPLHPAEAVVYLQATDAHGLVEAYKESSWADVVFDEGLHEVLAEVLEVDVADLPLAIAGGWEEAQSDPSMSRLINNLPELRGLSASLCLQDQDPVAILVEYFEGDRSAFDGAKKIKLQCVLEFTSPQAASSALADALLGLELQEAPFCKQDGKHLILSIGDLETSDGPGPSMQDRWGSLGAELGETNGVTILEAYSTLGDCLIQWAEDYVGYTGMDGPIGQAMTSAIGAPFLALTRGGAWRVVAKSGEFFTSGRYPHRSNSTVDEVFGSRALTEEDLSFIHPDAVIGGAISVDHDALLSWTRSLLALAGEAGDPEVLGFDPIGDLIEPLGDSVHWSLQGNFGVGVPPSQMSFRVTDEEALKRGIQGLAAWIEVATNGDVVTKSGSYKKVELTTFQLHDNAQSGNSQFDLALMIRPTLAVFDGRVILTPNRTLAKRAVKRLRKEQEGRSTMALALAHNPKYKHAGSVSFGDWMWVLGRFTKMAKSAVALADVKDLPFDLALLPEPEFYTPYFGPSIEIRTHGKNSVLYESRSNVGMESVGGVLVGIGLAASVVVPRIMVNFSRANEAKCKADLMALLSAIENYRIQNGDTYPQSLEDLLQSAANEKAYLAQTEVPKDPWGTAYQYDPELQDGFPLLWSCGPDGVDSRGQGDDILLESFNQLGR